MEILVYLLGNACCIGAAGLMLMQLLRGSHCEQELHVSKDLLFMCLLGAVLRCYWSMSPPEIWSEEDYLTQWICIFDLVGSLLVWGACAFLATRFGSDMWAGLVGLPKREAPLRETTKKPASRWYRYSRWPVLCAAAGVLAYIGTHILPTLSVPGAWPAVDFAVVSNMLIDGMAMVPQMLLLTDKHDSRTPQLTSHFVGMLCIGRVLRMAFWLFLVLHPQSGHALWTFVLPDFFHTIVMGDFLYHYVKKIRADSADFLASTLVHTVYADESLSKRRSGRRRPKKVPHFINGTATEGLALDQDAMTQNNASATPFALDRECFEFVKRMIFTLNAPNQQSDFPHVPGSSRPTDIDPTLRRCRTAGGVELSCLLRGWCYAEYAELGRCWRAKLRDHDCTGEVMRVCACLRESYTDAMIHGANVPPTACRNEDF